MNEEFNQLVEIRELLTNAWLLLGDMEDDNPELRVKSSVLAAYDAKEEVNLLLDCMRKDDEPGRAIASGAKHV